MLYHQHQHSTQPKQLDGGPGSPHRVNNSRCSFSRNWLLYVAAETIEVADRGSYMNAHGDMVDVSHELDEAKRNSIHYHYSHEFQPDMASTPTCNTKVIVVYGTSLQVAAKLKGLAGDIGILNSASSRNPGEKFARGTVSQEDCICRASLLHPCLLQFKDLPDHYVQINSGYPEGSSSACAIFAPRVPIYRVDSERCPVLDTPQLCSILSMPAPNAFEVATAALEPPKGVEDQSMLEKDLSASPTSSISLDESNSLQFRQLLDRLYDRCFRALCILYENNCRHVVLCAFGCGVHGNDPEMVAEIFKLLLEDRFKGKFETVVFSIQPSRTYNFDAFTKVFPMAQTSIPESWSK